MTQLISAGEWYDPVDQNLSINNVLLESLRIDSTLEAIDVLTQCRDKLIDLELTANDQCRGYQLTLEHYMGHHSPSLDVSNMSLSIEQLTEKIRTIITAIIRQIVRTARLVIDFFSRLFKYWNGMKRKVSRAVAWAESVIKHNTDRQFADDASNDWVEFTNNEVLQATYSQEGQVVAFQNSRDRNEPGYINLKGADVVPIRPDPKAPVNPFQGMNRPILTLPIGTLKVLCNGRNNTSGNALAVIQVMSAFHNEYLSGLTKGLQSAIDYLKTIDAHRRELDQLIARAENNAAGLENDVHSFISRLHGPLDSIGTVPRKVKVLSQTLPGGMRAEYSEPPKVYKEPRLYDLTLIVDERHQYQYSGVVRLSNVRSLSSMKDLLSKIGDRLDGEIEPRITELTGIHKATLAYVEKLSARLTHMSDSPAQKALYSLWKNYLVEGPLGINTFGRIQRQVHYAFRVQSAFTEYLSAHLYAYEHPEPFLSRGTENIDQLSN